MGEPPHFTPGDKRRGNDAEEDEARANGFVPVMDLGTAGQLRALVTYLTTDCLGRRWNLCRAADKEGRVTWVKAEVIGVMRGCYEQQLDGVATMAHIAAVQRDPEMAEAIRTVWRLGGAKAVAEYLVELGRGN